MISAKSSKLWDYIVIFYISFLCISLELFLTRILNLKTFNHVVYVVIPFAILGYGIGANLYLLAEGFVYRFRREKVIAFNLILLSVLIVASILIIIRLPLTIKLLEEFFLSIRPGLMLSLSYFVLMIPFVVIGFLILFLFSENPAESPKFYFWDLVGAGAGAFASFFLINYLQLFHAIVFLSITVFFLGILFLMPQRKAAVLIGWAIISAAILHFIPEISNYESDAKGWENFTKFFKPTQFETINRRWHPMGRTDIYHILGHQRQDLLYYQAEGTFEINLKPRPDFSYFSTNFLGGTPVYKLSIEGLNERNSQLDLFSQAMEFPYVLLKNPRVVVIGAGGGRDIFMAKTHGATDIIAAEINPEVYRSMSPGGPMYEYSGKIYKLPGVKVLNIDGRNMVKNLPSESYDLIILNGVDTFSGLSSGAYAYAESYLYTKNAIMDYYRLLKPRGMMNFNRWIFIDEHWDRETIRLFTIIMDALRSVGVTQPWQNIMVGAHHGWGMTLVKKTPFTIDENLLVTNYWDQHKTDLVYPSKALSNRETDKLNYFDLDALAFINGKEKDFIKSYRFDISVITDDNPFFYKYYRFSDFKPKELNKASVAYSNYGAGFVIFLTQGLVLFNGTIFCLIFIGLPLILLRRENLKRIPGLARIAFVIYYACLGVGFMFIEIPIMQKFTLLLGSPIYAISVTLAALLIFAGIGSNFINFLKVKLGSGRLILGATILTIGLIFSLIRSSEWITNHFIGWPFAMRILMVCLILLPFGLCLGTFFPTGLSLIHNDVKGAMAWAWGINCGFSVIGSMLSIILAQFHGFNLILSIAAAIYLVAGLIFQVMAKRMT